jgi:hypothetical protein
VLVLDDRDLHEHGLDVGFQDLAGWALFLKLESEPADGLFEINQLHFLELIERVAHPDGDFLRGVGLIRLEVQVHRDFLHTHLLQELDVDIMRLSPIRPISLKLKTNRVMTIGDGAPANLLPEGGNRVISQLLDPVARFRA